MVTRRILAVSAALLLMPVGAVACSESADDAASPEEVVSQFQRAVRDEDLAALEDLLAPDVIHSEFFEDSATGERERFSPDMVGREAIVGLYTGTVNMPPQGEAVIDSPDTEVVDEGVVVHTKTLTHPTGFFDRTIVETVVSATGRIEHLSVIYEEPAGEIDEPSATEAAEFLNAIYVANGLPAPVEDPAEQYAFYRGNPPCQEQAEGMEGNDPDLVAVQLDAIASAESPVWFLAAQGLAEARAYCPARFFEYRDILEAAIGNTDVDRAYDWAAVPIG